MKLGFFLRCLTGLGSMALASVGLAQIASLKATMDLHISFQELGSDASGFHTYDPFGRFSVFELNALTIQDFHIFVAQPLERVPNDPDHDSLQSYYIENPDVWRVGKQFVHFGASHILKDNVLAVRSDQVIASLGLPVSVIACDGGKNLPQGIVVNFGGNYGLSIAVGDNFGISTTSLLAVRLPSQSPGSGNGYRRVYDAWYQVNTGHYHYWAEAAALKNGNSTTALDDFVSSLGVTYYPMPRKSVTFSIAHDSNQNADFYAVSAEIGLAKNLSLGPFVRFKNGNLFDASLSLNIKI